MVVRRVALTVVVIAFVLGGYSAIDVLRHREQRSVEKIAGSLRYGLRLETVTRAIDELREIAARSSDAEVVATVTRKLKALVLVANDTTDDGRAIRRRALGAIKSIRLNDLTQDFMAADLRKNDIIDADLTRATMKGLDLSGSFMIRTRFDAADLTGVNLSTVWIRNADFAAATLTGANLRGTDWFNAEGFAPSQLGSADRTTIARCPQDAAGQHTEAAFRTQLDRGYSFKWDQMGSDRDHLLRIWKTYPRPGRRLRSGRRVVEVALTTVEAGIRSRLRHS